MLNLQVYCGIYRDYFFPNIYEGTPGKGMYLPYYVLNRSQNYSQSQIDDTFTALKNIKVIREAIYYGFFSIGAVCLLLAAVIFLHQYRKHQLKGWKSGRKVLLVREPDESLGGLESVERSSNHSP